MRYPPRHKASTRRRIVAGAAAALRARGVSGVGVAELMRQAGLTHGAFYSHFASKDALVAEAFDVAGEQSVRNLRRAVQRAGDKPPFKAIVDAYLSPPIATVRSAAAHLRRWRPSWRASRPQRAGL
jgi:TetR/AcrR family transcriptional repressor of nem operon